MAELTLRVVVQGGGKIKGRKEKRKKIFFFLSSFLAGSRIFVCHGVFCSLKEDGRGVNKINEVGDFLSRNL